MSEEAVGSEEAVDKSALEPGAMRIVKRYMGWSAGAGIVPVPLLDIAAVSGVQLKMLKELGDHYGVTFKEHRAKSFISSTLSGFVANGLAYGSVGSLIKSIPGPGTLFGMISMPAFASATAYALGRVFIQHFSSGGTFLDFDPDKVRGYFKQEFETAKSMAKGEGATKSAS